MMCHYSPDARSVRERSARPPTRVSAGNECTVTTSHGIAPSISCRNRSRRVTLRSVSYSTLARVRCALMSGSTLYKKGSAAPILREALENARCSAEFLWYRKARRSCVRHARALPYSPAARLGLMYAGVPAVMPSCVCIPAWSDGAIDALPMSKSGTRACLSCTRMLSGLMSRCTTSRRCA